jgi:acyl-CoA thioester hydrolase
MTETAQSDDADRRRAFAVWTTDRLRYDDLDPVGHVNNKATGTFFETGRVTFMIGHLGPLTGARTLFLLVKNTIEYLAEIHYPGEVHVGTNLKRVGGSSVELAQVLYSGDTVAARAESVLVQIDSATRKSLRIGDDLRMRLDALLRG